MQKSDPLDWHLLRAFLATAEAGSPSAASRRIRLVFDHLAEALAEPGTAPASAG